jgi:hypothetical protein
MVEAVRIKRRRVSYVMANVIRIRQIQAIKAGIVITGSYHARIVAKAIGYPQLNGTFRWVYWGAGVALLHHLVAIVLRIASKHRDMDSVREGVKVFFNLNSARAQEMGFMEIQLYSDRNPEVEEPILSQNVEGSEVALLERESDFGVGLKRVVTDGNTRIPQRIENHANGRQIGPEYVQTQIRPLVQDRWDRMKTLGIRAGGGVVIAGLGITVVATPTRFIGLYSTIEIIGNGGL